MRELHRYLKREDARLLMLKAVPIGNNGNGPRRFQPRVDLSVFSPKVAELFGGFVGEVNLNLTRGPVEPGFENVGWIADGEVDTRSIRPADLAGFVQYLDTSEGRQQLDRVFIHGVTPLAEERDSVDCILASQVLEHVTHLIPLLRECHRVLRPLGFLCISVPYASSDDAWEDPTHVRAFTERTFTYFTPAMCPEVDFTFEQVVCHLIPTPERMSAAQHAAVRGQHNMLDVWKVRERNVIKELVVVLQKPEGL